jgi:hypothetical protein
VVAIQWPINTAPGLRTQDGAGRLINVYPETRENGVGTVWRRAPGAEAFTTIYPGTAAITGTGTATFVGFSLGFGQGVLSAGSVPNITYGTFISASEITGGTVIGNFSNSTAARNGTAFGVSNSLAANGPGSSSLGYIGITMDTPSAVGGCVVYGSTAGHTSASSYEIALYGSTGSAPANSTNGTLLGTVSGTDFGGTNPQSIDSSDKTTVYDHVWIHHRGGGVSKRVAELTFYRTT